MNRRLSNLVTKLQDSLQGSNNIDMNNVEDSNVIFAELPNSSKTFVKQETPEYITVYSSSSSSTTQGCELNLEDNINADEAPSTISCFIKQEIYEDDDVYDVLMVKQEELTIKNENVQPLFVSINPTNQNLRPNRESEARGKTQDEKLFACSSCNYQTNEERYLVDHRHIHTEVTPYNCTFCNYKSKKKSNFTRHVSTHTGQKPFNCSVCSHKSTDKASFALHLKIHTGEKPFSCTMCDYKCIIKGDLVRHLRIHTGEKPYKCHLCDYKCTAKGRLNRHVKGHAKQRSFSCELCDYECVHERNLQKHIVKTHSEKKSDECPKSDSNNCVSLKEEPYWFEENSEVDGEPGHFNLRKSLENVQNPKDVVIKVESLWMD